MVTCAGNPDSGTPSGLATALGPFWLHGGLFEEGRRQLDRAIADPPPPGVAPELLVEAAAWEARLAADQGVVGGHRDAAAAVERLERALTAARHRGDLDATLRCIDFLSHVLSLHEDTERAEALTDEGIALSRANERPWWLSQLLQRAGVFARLRGDNAAAAILASEAFDVARRIGADRLVLHAGETLAQLPSDEAVEDPPSLDWLFELAMAVGDARVASRLLLSMATEELLAGSLEGAAILYGRGLAMTREIGYWHGSGHGLMGCAVLAGLSGNAAQGARLHGSVMVHVPVLRRGIPPAYFALYDQMIGEVRASLSRTEFDRHMFDGTRLAWDDAIDEAQSFTADLVQESGSGMTAHPVTRPARQPSSARAVTGEGQQAQRTGSTLTERELEVLGFIAAGESNKDIARLIGVSPKTVMHHSVSIYRKLAVRGRAEATAVAIQRGLVSGNTGHARPVLPHLA